MAELHGEGVLQNAWGHSREVLEDSVGWDVRESKRVLLPLGAHGEHFTGVVELQVSDRGRQIVQRLERTVVEEPSLC